MTQAIGLNLIKDSVKLQGECNGDSSTTAVRLFLHIVLIGIVGMIVVVVDYKVAVVLLGSLSGLLWLPAALGTWLLLLSLFRWSSSVVEVARVGSDSLLGLNWGGARVVAGFYSGKDVAKETLRQH